MSKRKKSNNRKINSFMFSKEDSFRDIDKIKKEFNEISTIENYDISVRELYSFVEGVESISKIVKLDILTLFTGVLYSIRDAIQDEDLNPACFDIEFEEGVKLKVPFLMRKGFGTPLYYLDMGKHNIRFYQKIKKMFEGYEDKVNLYPFDDIFEKSNPRRINISQQTFLTGYALGQLFKIKEISFNEFYDILTEEYNVIHKKHND